MGEQGYDVYLNGVGYMLMRDASGTLLGGMPREQMVDSFSNKISESKWQEAIFKFGEGAGRKEYDSTGRYRWGLNADTRGGRLILGPKVDYTIGTTNVERVDEDIRDWRYVLGREIMVGGNEKLAFQFVPNSKEYRSFGIMIRRSLTVDYSSVIPFRVELWNDAGNVPSGIIIPDAYEEIPLKAIADEWTPDEDLWLSGDWFWCWGHFTHPLGVAPTSDACWLVVHNPNDKVLEWGYDATSSTTVNLATHDGTGWTVTTGKRPLVKLYPHDEVDHAVADICAFRGTDFAAAPPADNYRRIYAAVGPKVMYYDDAASTWKSSKPSGVVTGFSNRVTDLIVWNRRLLAAQGVGDQYWQFTGAGGENTWSDGGSQAYCFCVHDDHIWKALGGSVFPGDDSTPIVWKTTGAGGGIDAGDPGTPVTALCSHEGKLYAAKPEGIFRIDYPGGDYAHWDIEDANAILVLDFSADRAGRPWLVSWESGLYFPTSGGVCEWKNGLLQNIWALYMDTQAASNVGDINCGYRGWWQSCVPTPNGLVLGFQSNYREVSQFWFYKSGEWHPIFSTDPWVGTGAALADPRCGRPVGAVAVDSKGGGVGILHAGIGPRIAKLIWPTWTKDMMQDNAARYTEHAIVTLPTFGLDKPHMKKDWHGVKLLTKGMGAIPGGPWGLLGFRLNDADTWSLATDLVTTSPSQTIIFPSTTASYTIDLMLTIYAFLTPPWGPFLDTITPVVEAATLLYQELPDTIRTWSLWIDATNPPGNRSGGTGITRKAVDTNLRALMEADEPFAFIDELGNTFDSVKVQGITRQVNDMYREVGDGGTQAIVQMGYIVTLMEV